MEKTKKAINYSIKCKCGAKTFFPVNQMKFNAWTSIACNQCGQLLKIPPQELLKSSKKSP